MDNSQILIFIGHKINLIMFIKIKVKVISGNNLNKTAQTNKYQKELLN